MKLWKKDYSLNEKIENFTVGNDRVSDLVLAEFDITASIAHAKMLCKSKILSADEKNQIISELKKIKSKINEGSFKIEKRFEDVHSKIEFLLVEKLGDTGKKIHTGRSRNDQVLVATQLYLKSEIIIIKKMVKSLFDILIDKAKQNKNKLMPGYTHLQVAMPSSFGLWFSAYAEALIDDIIYLNTAYKINNQNPLGSAAGYGSSFNIDREYTTKELGFETLKFNVLSAQFNRGRVEESVAHAIGTLAKTLSKLSTDICFYMTSELNFISFPDNYTTGSSIMPHKKNPDVFELVRARCNNIQSLHNQLTFITNNLTSGYHRDFQLMKEKIIDGVQNIKSCLEILSFSIKKVEIRDNILENHNYKYINSVDALNNLIKKENMPFRDAYTKISSDIKKNKFKLTKRNKHTLTGSIDNLCLNKIEKKMNNNFIPI